MSMQRPRTWPWVAAATALVSIAVLAAGFQAGQCADATHMCATTDVASPSVLVIMGAALAGAVGCTVKARRTYQAGRRHSRSI